MLTMIKAVAASPYGSLDELEKAADEIRDCDADLIVLDCIGYSQEMKEMFARKTGKKCCASKNTSCKGCIRTYRYLINLQR